MNQRDPQVSSRKFTPYQTEIGQIIYIQKSSCKISKLKKPEEQLTQINKIVQQ
jgi:hypothetical protein